MLQSQNFQWDNFKIPKEFSDSVEELKIDSPEKSSQEIEEADSDRFLMAHNPELLLTSEAYWMMISAQYFPQVLTQKLKDDRNELDKSLEHLLSF